MVVTGASGGIGSEVARSLVIRGDRVVLAGRNIRRLDAMRRDLLRAAPGAAVEVASVDLSSLEAARAGAAAVGACVEQVDVVVANAGLYLRGPARSDDGYELHFAVMYLGHCQLLADLAAATSGSASQQAVFVSAWGHRFGRLELESGLRDPLPTGFAAYCRAKLAQVLYAREAARRPEGPAIISCHPGVVRTALGQDDLPGPVGPLLRVFASSPAVSGQAIANLASLAEPAAGDYHTFVTARRRMKPGPVPPGRRGRDLRAAETLFELTQAALVG